MILGPDGKSTLVFSDKIDDDFCFDIKSGEVTIYIDNDMTLTNENVEPKRSAINIEPNAKLNLYIAKGVTLTVNSGFGEKGETANGLGAKGGPGGYAGIRVPWIDGNNDNVRDEEEQAELNLYGEGTIVAIGGNAGDGGGAVSGNTGGRRRSDGAGARNRSEIGGKGGDANKTFNGGTRPYSYGLLDSGACGDNGESCGVIKIIDSVKVFAYGGSGRWGRKNG